MTKIVIDQELEKVCLPLKEDEYSTLEKQLIRDGCLDPLKVWDRDGELVLLDGHNRLKICKERKIPFETSTIEISSIDEAIVWIVDNQDGRRNSTEQEKAAQARDTALQGALTQIERQFGKGSLMRMGDPGSRVPIAGIPTGALSLDLALGIGGVPRGRIIEIYGPESSGKTTLALHTIAEAQKAGVRTIVR